MIAGLRVGPFGDRPGGETAPRDEWSAEWVYSGFGAGSRRQPGHVRTRRDTYCKPVKQVARFLSALRERIRFREASSSPNCRRLFVVIAARGRA